MSLLQQRLITTPGTGSQSFHPYGTGDTPMVVPLAEISFNRGHGFYNELYPSPEATGDVNAVPMAVVAPGTWGKVKAAGRP